MAANDPYKARGERILQMAELIRPALLKRLSGCHDASGMPVPPERIRAVALIVAQQLVRDEEKASAA